MSDEEQPEPTDLLDTIATLARQRDEAVKLVRRGMAREITGAREWAKSRDALLAEVDATKGNT